MVKMGTVAPCPFSPLGKAGNSQCAFTPIRICTMRPCRRYSITLCHGQEAAFANLRRNQKPLAARGFWLMAGYAFFLVGLLAAFFTFSLTRYFTILVINFSGSGLSNGNLIAPLEVSYLARLFRTLESRRGLDKSRCDFGGGEINEVAVLGVGGHSVAEDFSGVGCGGFNSCAQLLKDFLFFGWKGGNVFVGVANFFGHECGLIQLFFRMQCRRQFDCACKAGNIFASEGNHFDLEGANRLLGGIALPPLCVGEVFDFEKFVTEFEPAGIFRKHGERNICMANSSNLSLASSSGLLRRSLAALISVA